MFGSNKAEYVTRNEAQSYVEGVAQDTTRVRNSIAELRAEGESVLRDIEAQLAEGGRRLEALEALAAQIKGSPISTPARRADLPQRAPGASLGVDYGAVAFGLSQIKHDVHDLIAGANVGTSTAELTQHYRETVQYFADVFAKADPAFNEAEFKRQAGA